MPRGERRAAIRAAGGLRAISELLGQLHTLQLDDGAAARAGGCWHHLSDGSPSEEITVIRQMLSEAKALIPKGQEGVYESLLETIGELDSGAGLPSSFIHPDFVLANIIAPPEGGLVIIDWAGAGQAPRTWSLAFLLWAVGFGGDLNRVDRVIAGYRRHIEPNPQELERLQALVRARPLIFDAWSFCTNRKQLPEVVQGMSRTNEIAALIAERARNLFLTW